MGRKCSGKSDRGEYDRGEGVEMIGGGGELIGEGGGGGNDQEKTIWGNNPEEMFLWEYIA